ncbi:MAG: bifunctional adenosylcobinamide kinase/adenosylcobinamide-phosphate guanylyltransferase [Oscillospiraceae bacterium]|nr:bifunctional adenosylcobinamide kinase/adenosylcobinamide-phosphate guanylyltransferase [Oscillospiraceae bacterium]
MTVLTGAAYSGKTDYCRAAFSPPTILDGAVCSPEEALRASCIAQFQVLIRRILAENADPVAFTEQLIHENPGCIILLDEIGCGIIPLDREERRWREMTGRCGCLLTAFADTVIRLCCGIPSALKGELP